MKNLFLLCVLITLIVTPGLAYSATTWYLPEGSTQGTFDLWILVANPNSADASVTFTFYTGGGGTITKSTTIAAESRYTLKVNDIAGLDNAAISTKVECTNGLNIYAERAMYWSESEGGTWIGGHTSRAVSGLEGCYTEISQPSSFPITISQSGSYKLIQNITCSTVDVNAIEITANDITLDLNGFTITGPGYNSGSSGRGIVISNTAYRATITNGTIRNFRKTGIYAYSNHCNLTNLRIDYNGEWGIYQYACYSGIIQDCIFSYNGMGEINASTGGLYVCGGNIVRNNNFDYNKGFGIYVASDSNVIERNNIYFTRLQGDSITEAGISIGGNYNRIEGNNCTYNDTYDIHLRSTATNNLYILNTVRTAIQNDGGGTNISTIVSHGNLDL